MGMLGCLTVHLATSRGGGEKLLCSAGDRTLEEGASLHKEVGLVSWGRCGIVGGA